MRTLNDFNTILPALFFLFAEKISLFVMFCFLFALSKIKGESLRGMRKE